MNNKIHKIIKNKYNYLEMIETKSHGLGIRCNKKFKKGEIVFTYKEGILMQEQTQHSLQVRPEVFLEHPIAGYVQHSCNPNCWASNSTLQFICKIDIKAGDMITMDYEQTEDELFKAFNCTCASPICRGYISGRLVVD